MTKPIITKFSYAANNIISQMYLMNKINKTINFLTIFIYLFYIFVTVKMLCILLPTQLSDMKMLQASVSDKCNIK